MENSTSIFKFVTVRNGVYEPSENPDVLIQPPTELVTDLIAINESEVLTSGEKFEEMNALLQDFIDTPAFVRTQAEFDAMKIIQDDAPLAEHVDTLYDNIIVRVMTRSNTSRIFRQLIVQLKSIYADVYSHDVADLSVLIPERLILSFTGFHAADPPVEEEDDSELTDLLTNIEQYTNLQKLLVKAKKANVVSFPSLTEVKVRNTKYSFVNDVLRSDSISLTDAKTLSQARLMELTRTASKNRRIGEAKSGQTIEGSLDEVVADNITTVNSEQEQYQRVKALIQQAEAAGVTTFERETLVPVGQFEEIPAQIKIFGITLEDAEAFVSDRLARDYEALDAYIRPVTYTQIANQWVDLSRLESAPVNGESTVEGDSIVVYANGCYLRFPFFVADLRVIEQMAVGYLPAEIAHINNTQSGEKHVKKTRRLKRVESLESLISENEVFHETDTQSTEKFTLEREGANVESSESSFNVNASASGSFGPYSASVDAGYGTSESSASSNSFSQSYAKNVFQRVVDRISSKVRSERTLKTIEEFEERVKHVIDNSGKGTKSYIYRWLNKLVRGTLKNYGKRLMFQVDVAHPAHYYLSRSISEQQKLNIPQDPRTLKIGNIELFKVDTITRENYLNWAKKYEAKLEQPPVKTIRVSETFNGSTTTITGKLLPIKKGYACRRAFVSNTYAVGWPGGHQIRVIVGNRGYAYYSEESDLYGPRELWLDNETEQLPISIFQGGAGFILNVEVECELTPEAYEEWQLKCYHAIIEAYDNLKAQAESKMSEWNPNLPGLNPSQKLGVIRTELKKEALRKMNRCNPFWISDNYVVGQEYKPNCCAETTNAEKIRFLESVFDWNNMTYELHPYFYADDDNWAQLLNLSDDDPHFEAFLQSSYATVRIPVHRDALKERAAVNYIMNNSIANYETIPENMQPLLDELDNEVASLFTVDLEGNDIPVPKTTVDLGIFPIPTNLVILECGNSDGIKPIGFPQDETPPTSDVLIPKQYSPAIIADSCTAPAPAPLETITLEPSTPPSPPEEPGGGE